MNLPEITEFLGRELSRSHQERQPLSLIMVDIDYFKSVNDELGPEARPEVRA